MSMCIGISVGTDIYRHKYKYRLVLVSILVFVSFGMYEYVKLQSCFLTLLKIY